MSHHTVHSYLRSIKCLASWLVGAGHLTANPFLAVNPYYKRRGVMPVLRADDRIPKIGRPSDVAILLAGCDGDGPEDLRDRALIWMAHQDSRGRDRGRGPKPLPGEAGEGFKDDDETRGDQDEACPAEGAKAVARRPRLPAGD